MCGIFGFDRLTDVTRAMAPILAWEMESRGKDAWGATDGNEVIKHLGPITESWELPTWERGIFHTRAASTGSGQNVDNAHPFSFPDLEGLPLIGIHNGIVRNHTELNKKYDRDFKVDSMHIFAHLAQKLPLEELEGYAALAWYEKGELNLAKFNSWDLHVATLVTGEIVFCSRFDVLKRAAKMFGSGIKTDYTICERTRYTVRPDEHGQSVLWKCGELPFGNAFVRHIATTSGGGRYYSSQYFPEDNKTAGEKCFSCGRITIDRKTSLLCRGCFDKEIAMMRGLGLIERFPFSKAQQGAN